MQPGGMVLLDRYGQCVRDTLGLSYFGDNEKWKEMGSCRNVHQSRKKVHSKGKAGFTSHPQQACVCACLCLGKPGLPLTNESADREKAVNSMLKATVQSGAPHRGDQQPPAEGTAVGAEILFVLSRAPRASPPRGAPCSSFTLGLCIASSLPRSPVI